MSLSIEAIDRIVANVLSQIGTGTPVVAVQSAPEVIQNTIANAKAKTTLTNAVSLPGAVITAEDIHQVPVQSTVTVQPRAIVTPAAWDAIRDRQIHLQRGAVETGSRSSNRDEDRKTVPVTTISERLPLLVVVRSTPAAEQFWQGRSGSWRREWIGCPDDAAKLAIGEICRGAAPYIVIFAEQIHRAACLANRDERVKAVAVRSAGEVKEIRKSLRANVWCLNPEGLSWFELKNLIQHIGTASLKQES